MAERGVIIAIQDYGPGDLHGTLKGTNEAALAFYSWLTGRRNINPEDIVVCAGEAVSSRAAGSQIAGTSRNEIEDALYAAVRTWQTSSTERLYVFFSGHGASLVERLWPRHLIDALVASDYTDADHAPRACIRLDDLQEELGQSLGVGDHFYFVDACRTTFRVKTPGPVLDFPSLEQGTPNVHTLFSTTAGALADTRSRFGVAVVDGLSGKGRAKTWMEKNELWVKFDRLAEWVKRQVHPQEVDPRPGSGLGLIWRIEPPCESACEVDVRGAVEQDHFRLVLRSVGGNRPPEEFSGARHGFPVLPLEYMFSMEHPTADVVQEDPGDPWVDLYDSRMVRFRLRPRIPAVPPPRTGPPEGPPPPPTPGGSPPVGVEDATLIVDTTPAGVLVLESYDGDTSEVALTSTGKASLAVRPGNYHVRLRERGVTLVRTETAVVPGEVRHLRLVPPTTEAHASLLREMGEDPEERAAVLSESLGPMASRDLGLWLALAGASRITPRREDLSRLDRIQLTPWFEAVPPGSAPVYVLAGFTRLPQPSWFGLSPGPYLLQQQADKVCGVRGITEQFFQVSPGPHLLSVGIPGHAPATLTVHSFSDRVTLVTFSDNERGELEAFQFVLPLHTLLHRLKPSEIGGFASAPMAVVRAMHAAQKLFARKRDVHTRLEPADYAFWMQWVYGEWVDPVMSVMAAHTLIRSGGRKALPRWLAEILVEHFSGFPDATAIARLARVPAPEPVGAPLFRESLRLLRNVSEVHPLPVANLDRAGPWTVWNDAVTAYKSILAFETRMNAEAEDTVLADEFEDAAAGVPAEEEEEEEVVGEERYAFAGASESWFEEPAATADVYEDDEEDEAEGESYGQAEAPA